MTARTPGSIAGNGPDYLRDQPTKRTSAARIAGVDFGVHYTQDFGKFGKISIGVDGTYYLQYKETDAARFEVLRHHRLLHRPDRPGLAVPVDAGGRVQDQGFTASALGNYIPSARDARNISLDPTPAFGGTNPDKAADLSAATGLSHLPNIRDYYTIDLLFSYEFLPPAPADAPVPARQGRQGRREVRQGRQGWQDAGGDQQGHGQEHVHHPSARRPEVLLRHRQRHQRPSAKIVRSRTSIPAPTRRTRTLRSTIRTSAGTTSWFPRSSKTSDSFRHLEEARRKPGLFFLSKRTRFIILSSDSSKKHL